MTGTLAEALRQRARSSRSAKSVSTTGPSLSRQLATTCSPPAAPHQGRFQRTVLPGKREQSISIWRFCKALQWRRHWRVQAYRCHLSPQAAPLEVRCSVAQFVCVCRLAPTERIRSTIFETTSRTRLRRAAAAHHARLGFSRANRTSGQTQTRSQPWRLGRTGEQAAP